MKIDLVLFGISLWVGTIMIILFALPIYTTTDLPPGLDRIMGGFLTGMFVIGVLFTILGFMTTTEKISKDTQK
jgi:hypothetical protein